MEYVLLVDGEDERALLSGIGKPELEPGSALLGKHAREGEGDGAGARTRASGLFAALLHGDEGVAVPEADLEPCPPAMRRIDATVLGASASHLPPHPLVPLPFFERFEESTGRFLPSPELAHLFPADVDPEPAQSARGEVEARFALAARELLAELLELASSYEGRIPAPDPEGGGGSPFWSLARRAAQFGRAQPWAEAGASAVFLFNLHNEVSSVERSRARLKDVDTKFGCGDVVFHKVYNFRGVVQAVDPFPRLDVSNWDGLQHIENLDQPFYLVVPVRLYPAASAPARSLTLPPPPPPSLPAQDTDDAIKSFGAPRPYRYVIEENLLPVTDKERADSVRINDATRESLGMRQDPGTLKWRCSDDMEMRHPAHDDAHKPALEFFAEANQLFADFFNDLRVGRASRFGDLCLDDLYELLRTAATRSESKAMENLLGEVVIAARDKGTREKVQILHDLVVGGRKMYSRDKTERIPELDAFVSSMATSDSEEDGEWLLPLDLTARQLFNAEKYADALKVVDEILTKDPRRISMYLLRAQICMKRGEMAEAREAYDAALERHPWISANRAIYEQWATLSEY